MVFTIYIIFLIRRYILVFEDQWLKNNGGMKKRGIMKSVPFGKSIFLLVIAGHRIFMCVYYKFLQWLSRKPSGILIFCLRLYNAFRYVLHVDNFAYPMYKTYVFRYICFVFRGIFGIDVSLWQIIHIIFFAYGLKFPHTLSRCSRYLNAFFVLYRRSK